MTPLLSHFGMKEMRLAKHRGFTLIEILIALTIFAIIASLTASSMYYAFNTRTRINLEAERLIELQLGLNILERDVIQAANRPVRGNEMRLFGSFIGQPKYVEFTRAGITNPQSAKKQASLQRIALICSSNQLIRRLWTRLDVRDRAAYQDRVLIKNLKGCHFRFLNKNLQVLDEWQEDFVSSAYRRQEIFPKALQLTLNVKEWGEGVFLFPIAAGLYDSI